MGDFDKLLSAISYVRLFFRAIFTQQWLFAFYENITPPSKKLDFPVTSLVAIHRLSYLRGTGLMRSSQISYTDKTLEASLIIMN